MWRISRNWQSIKKANKNTELALDHFDSLYVKIYGKQWPSMRLGLLSPKKQCAVLNTFIDCNKVHDHMVNELGAIDLARYYKKHLVAYTRWKLREQIIENKKSRKRELIANTQNVSPESIDLSDIEVSDVSDSELKVAQNTDVSDGGLSSAEDLQDMFTDRRLDDDERYFINQASTRLSLADYVPASEFIYKEAVVDELVYYEGFKHDLDFSIKFKEEPSLEIGNELKMFAFPRNVWTRFEPPEVLPVSKLMTYYLLDGASLLPVLALDLKIGDVCADYCAAPGGKSISMLMSLKPKYLLCNDSSKSRLARLARVVKQYIPNINYLKSTLEVKHADARTLIYPDTFDKILVDAPCSNDRNSVEMLDNNIFKRARTEERLNLPITQCDILKAALKSLKISGSAVYSTCTLSPLENDGVIQRALVQLQEEGFHSKFAIVNLKEAFRPLRGLYKFYTRFNYGQQVVPNICTNFGPMYISKIKRIE